MHTSLQTEEGHLQDAGRKDDLVLGRRVVRVDLRRGHAPLGAVHRLEQLVEVLLEGELVEPDAVVEVVVVDHSQLAVLLVERRIVLKKVGWDVLN